MSSDAAQGLLSAYTFLVPIDSPWIISIRSIDVLSCNLALVLCLLLWKSETLQKLSWNMIKNSHEEDIQHDNYTKTYYANSYIKKCFYRTCIICQNLQMQLIKGPTKLKQSSQPWPEHKNHYSQSVQYVSCPNIHFHIRSMTQNPFFGLPNPKLRHILEWVFFLTWNMYMCMCHNAYFWKSKY